MSYIIKCEECGKCFNSENGLATWCGCKIDYKIN